MTSLVDSFQNYHGALLIFFEGAITNGQGILMPQQAMLGDIIQINKKFERMPVFFNISYPDKSHYSPINTTRNPIWSTILMMTNFNNQI